MEESCRGRVCLGNSIGGWQRKPKPTAPAHLAIDADFPALSFYQLLGDSEPQPRPAVLAGA